MPIRTTSSSGMSSRGIASFLSGYAQQATQIQYAKEDHDFQNGQSTNDQYLSQLRDRLPSLKPLQRADMQNTIQNLQVKMQRDQITTDIDQGKANYADLVKFDSARLAEMQPGSNSYESQQKLVDAGIQKVVDLGRQKITDNINLGTPGYNQRSLANYEKSMVTAFNPGTPAYNNQMYKAQSAIHTADKTEYQQAQSIDDAKFNDALRLARAKGDVAQSSNLVQQQAQNIQQRVQQHPEYFQDSNGNWDANYYQAVSSIDSMNISQDTFASQQAQKIAAAAKINANQKEAVAKLGFDSQVLQAQQKVSQVEKDSSIDGVTKQGILASLNGDLQQALDAKNNFLGLAAQVAIQNGDVNAASSLQNEQFSVQAAKSQAQSKAISAATLANGSASNVSTLDSSGKITGAKSVSLDAQGRPMVNSLNEGFANLQNPTEGPGQTSGYTLVTPKGTVQSQGPNGAPGDTYQYFIQSKPDGTSALYLRDVGPPGSTNPQSGAFDDANNHNFIAVDINKALAQIPALKSEIPPDQLDALQKGSGGPQLSVSPPGTTGSSSNLTSSPLLDQVNNYVNRNDNTDSSSSPTSQASSSTVNSDKQYNLQVQDTNPALVPQVAAKNAALTGQNDQLSGQNSQLSGENSQLTATNQAEDQANSGLSNKVADLTNQFQQSQGSLNDAHSRADALEAAVNNTNQNVSGLQKTLNMTALQNTAYAKFLQGAATTDDLSKAGITLGSNFKAGQTLQQAMGGTSLQGSGATDANASISGVTTAASGQGVSVVPSSSSGNLSVQAPDTSGENISVR